ncbi:hypothetical protein NHQ30_008584 [Ciborinia camelliae]|nr:hypothetical protein NHQ30_008584 [Ciborinia camelliae]
MKSILFVYPSLLLTLLAGIGLSVAHLPMESKGAVATSNKYSSHYGKPTTLKLGEKVEVLTSSDFEQPPPTSFSLLIPSIQNLALLTTLSALGFYTPALIGIGIMTSNVQASSVTGMSPGNSWGPSKLDHKRRRAHPRDISINGPDTEDNNSYHVAEVLVKKFEGLVGRVDGQFPRFKSPGNLPKFAVVGREITKKGESTDFESYDLSAHSDDQLHPLVSGLTYL